MARIQSWMESQAPIIWLLGKAQSGKTSIVAEMTGQAHDQVGNGFEPLTKTAKLYAFPEASPVVRFLDTRGLADIEAYDPKLDLKSAMDQAHVVMVVARVDDLEPIDVIEALREARKANRQRPVIVAQTTLHKFYRPSDSHADPYPFTGTDDDFNLPGLSDDLRKALMVQRLAFKQKLPGAEPIFVPLDFTRPEDRLPPADFGSERLFDVLHEVLPGVVEWLVQEHDRGRDIRLKVVAPWAFAAAAANAAPVPVLGGLGSASLQAVMVNNIGRRFGFEPRLDMWGEFVATLGAGFALGFGGAWVVQQFLKLGLGWGTAIVAAWTFAITWGIGEAAIYHFGEKAAGREPDPDRGRRAYREAFSQAWRRYRAGKPA